MIISASNAIKGLSALSPAPRARVNPTDGLVRLMVNSSGACVMSANLESTAKVRAGVEFPNGLTQEADILINPSRLSEDDTSIDISGESMATLFYPSGVRMKTRFIPASGNWTSDRNPPKDMSFHTIDHEAAKTLADKMNWCCLAASRELNRDSLEIDDGIMYATSGKLANIASFPAGIKISLSIHSAKAFAWILGSGVDVQCAVHGGQLFVKTEQLEWATSGVTGTGIPASRILSAFKPEETGIVVIDATQWIDAINSVRQISQKLRMSFSDDGSFLSILATDGDGEEAEATITVDQNLSGLTGPWFVADAALLSNGLEVFTGVHVKVTSGHNVIMTAVSGDELRADIISAVAPMRA